MSDLISRQAAIDALAKAMPSLTTPDGCGEFDHEIQITDEAFVDAMRIINDLPSAQPEWIPFDDGAPEEKYETGNGRQFSDYFLITVVNHEDDETFVDVAYTVDGDWKTANRDAYIPKYCEITAWMPLPEPYRKDCEAE